MKTRLTLTWICNLIDIIATLYLCTNGYAVELNPFIRLLLPYPIIFVIVKVSIITYLLFWLWRERDSKYAVIGSYVGCFIYGVLALHYIVFMAMIQVQ